MVELMARKRKAGGGQKGAGEPAARDDRSGRKSAPIQVDKQLARWAAVVASHRGITQAELVSPVLRPFLLAQYRLVQEEMGQEIESDEA